MMNIIFYNPKGFFTLIKREVNRFFKVYIQTMIAPLLSNMLFLGVFGGMFKTREIGIEGIGYLSFLVPGLVTMGAIFSSFQNPSFSLIAQKYQDTIQDLNSYPLSNFEKVLAFVIGGTIRGVLVGILTYIATIYFVGYKIEHPFYFIILLTTVSFIFSSLGVITGLKLNSFEKMNFILSIILTPLVYFGGVFFEISKLPGILSRFVYINPIFPLINLIRYSYLDKYEGNITIHLILSTTILITSFSFAFVTLKKGIGLKN